jgi:hypothetical protein
MFQDLKILFSLSHSHAHMDANIVCRVNYSIIKRQTTHASSDWYQDKVNYEFFYVHAYRPVQYDYPRPCQCLDLWPDTNEWLRVCVPRSLDGNARRTQEVYTGSGQRCPTSSGEGKDLYYPTSEVLVIGVTSELRERVRDPGLGV